MAIVQISRIQHRRGVNTDLPQLASAELGWSVDTRQLYIGNGTIEEGAPTLGNTEILTEYSDLLSIAQAYTFKGSLAGYTVQTGVSASDSISRSLQDKLDDFVNVRDFGAKGDGTTDDTAAINRALYQIFCITPGQPLVRRTIYFPAGNYKVSKDVVKIPSYARIRGDGSNRTFITQTDATQDCVAKLADSKQQIDANIGSNSAIPPQYITVEGASFVNQTNNDVVWVRTSKDVTFIDVAFVGSLTDVSTTNLSKSGVRLYTDGSLETSNVAFNGCQFKNQTYGLTGSDVGINNIFFNNVRFDTLHQGIKIGEGSSYPPNSFRIISSIFDNIFSSAINSYECHDVISAFNYYGDVGNGLLGPEFPLSDIIVYGGNGCYSVGDVFIRPDQNRTSAVQVNAGSTKSLVVIPSESIRFGIRRIGVGSELTLNPGLNETGISFGPEIPGASISYTIISGSTRRTGTFTVSHQNDVISYNDEYSETGDTGIIIQASSLSGRTSINCDNSGVGSATFKYSINWLV